MRQVTLDRMHLTARLQMAGRLHRVRNRAPSPFAHTFPLLETLLSRGFTLTESIAWTTANAGVDPSCHAKLYRHAIAHLKRNGTPYAPPHRVFKIQHARAMPNALSPLILEAAQSASPPAITMPASKYGHLLPVMDVLKARGFSLRESVTWLVAQGTFPASQLNPAESYFVRRARVGESAYSRKTKIQRLAEMAEKA